MLFAYKTSYKKAYGIGFSMLINLFFFLFFSYWQQNLSGLNILFLGAFFMYLVLFILQLTKRTQYKFYENQVQVHTKKESKTLSMLSLLFMESFMPHRNAKEKLHLVTSDGEYTFTEGEDDNFMLVKKYLHERVSTSIAAKYHYHISDLKEKIPSMIASLIFLVGYLYYFDAIGLGSIFFIVVLCIQAGTLLIYIGQWFYYKNKIKTTVQIEQ